jgi:hypothetical protein
MKKLSKRLIAAQARLDELAQVYVPEADQFDSVSDVWFEAITRDEQAAEQLRRDCAE